MNTTEPEHGSSRDPNPTPPPTGDGPSHADRRARLRKSGTTMTRVALALVTVVALVGAVVVAYRLEWWEGIRAFFSSAEAMREFVSGFGAWAPAVFFLAQVAQVVLAPIPGGATVVVGTLLFGVWSGLALSIAGAVAGSALLFVVVRQWGRPLASRLVGEENLQRYAGVLDKKGLVLFVILLVPFMPDDVVCALAGLSAVTLRRFVVLVAVGRTPSWLATALVTADLASRSAAVWMTAGIVVVVGTALAYRYRKRLEIWLLRRAGRNDGG